MKVKCSGFSGNRSLALLRERTVAVGVGLGEYMRLSAPNLKERTFTVFLLERKLCLLADSSIINE